MSTWTTISNALVAVGAKPFATTIQALRDNPVAIAEGAAGAPRIQTAALVAGEQMTTANVLARTAGASVGAVGTYAMLFDADATLNSTTRSPGTTRAGSTLRYSNAGQGVTSGSSPAGTWRLMGQFHSSGQLAGYTSVWLRIS